MRYHGRHAGVPQALSWQARSLIAAASVALLAGTGAATASVASAATFTDTAVQATGVPVSCGGIDITGNNSGTLVYHATGPGTAVLTGSSITHTSGTPGVVVATLSNPTYSLAGTGSGSEVVSVSLVFFDSFCGRGVTVGPILVTDVSGTLTSGTLAAPAIGDTITLNHPLNDNALGQVDFSATNTAVPAVTVLPGNLPGGLTAANPLVPGTATPGTYSHVTEVATDGSGALAFGEFTLKVIGNHVITPGNLGDEVNQFGNGFDVFKQHYAAGAIIAGWTATKLDPATNFVRNQNAAGNWQFEAVRASGVASGLCVSDPGGGWLSDPTPDGLILTPCNLGNFQRFAVGPAQPGGNELVNVATGKIVNPNGTGAQLTGGTAPSAWGGSGYAWKDHNQLP